MLFNRDYDCFELQRLCAHLGRELERSAGRWISPRRTSVTLRLSVSLGRRPGVCRTSSSWQVAILVEVALPSLDGAPLSSPPPDAGPGTWAGGASVVLREGASWLAYRMRRPILAGPGVSMIVGRSNDGVEASPSRRSSATISEQTRSNGPVLQPLHDRRLAALPAPRSRIPGGYAGMPG